MYEKENKTISFCILSYLFSRIYSIIVRFFKCTSFQKNICMNVLVSAEKIRKSNFELLRIVAMFLVLVVHADFYSLGVPTYEESVTNVLPSLSRFFFQSLSVGCVDIFVLISGYFGIRPRIKGFLNFIFQCLFFLCGIYVVCLILGTSTLSVNGALECFVMTNHNWFIKSYILLYVLAPILNAYIERASQKELRNTILMFYVFQSIYGWITSGVEFFCMGYSTMSFLGLYLLARYVRLYPNKFFIMPRNRDLLIFFSIVILQTLIVYTCSSHGITLPVRMRVYSYANPLVVISSLYLLLYFSKLDICSNFINKIGESCFAVFLLHQNANLIPFFKNTIMHIYIERESIFCLLLIFAFLLFLFILSILIDKIRIYFWNSLWKRLEPLFS